MEVRHRRTFVTLSTLLACVVLLSGALPLPSLTFTARAACDGASLGLKGYLPTTGGTAYGLAVAGTTAYVGDWNNAGGAGVLNVVDVGDPCQPRSLSSTPMPANEIGDLQARAGLVYVANDLDGLAVYDVTAPAKPVRTAARQDGTYAQTVTYDGSRYAYVGQIYSAGKELAIYDLANFPASAPTIYAPAFAGHRDIYAVQLAGERAYVLAGDGEGGNHLQVLNIANPRAPALLGDLPLPVGTYGGVGDFRVRGGYVYLATSAHASHDGGLVVASVADPAQMRVAGSLFLPDASAVPWRGGGLDIVGQRALVVGRGGLYSIDISVPSSPQKVGLEAFPATSGPALGGRVKVVGDLAYVGIFRDTAVAGSSGGLAIYKIDTGAAAACDAATVGLKGYLPTAGGTAYGLAMAGTTAYVGDWSSPSGPGTLHVVDVGDPCQPRTVASTPMPANEIGDLVAHGSRVYVANDADGLALYDVSAPAAPARLAARLDGTYAQSVAYDGSRYAYVGQLYSAGKELAIYDMASFPASAPTFYAPTFAGHRDIYAVQLAGDRAYVLAGNGEGGNHLLVLSLANPTAPALLGELSLPVGTYGGAGDLRVRAGYAYLATSDHPSHDGGLVVVSVSDPARMQVVGTYLVDDAGAVPWRGAALDVVGRRVFLVGRTGLYSLDIRNPSMPVLSGKEAFPPAAGPALGGRVRVVGDTAYVSIFRDSAVVTSTGGLAIYKVDTGISATCDLLTTGLKGYQPTIGGTAYGLAVAGATAYVGDWLNSAGAGALSTIDVANPCQPRSIASTPMPANEVGDLLLQGGRVYLANDGNGLAAYDVSVAEHPLRLAERLDGTYAHAVAYDGSRYAYVGQIYSAGKELAIYDMASFPAAAPTFYAPAFAGHRDIYTVRLDGDRAYVLAGNGSGDTHLQVLSLANPTAPALLGDLALPVGTYGAQGDLRVRDGYAYLATSDHGAHDGGLVVVSVANPAQMQVVGSLFLPDGGAVPWRGAALDLAGNRAFVVGRSGLYSVSVTNPAFPALVSQEPFPASAGLTLGGRVKVVGDLAYVTIFRDVSVSGSTGGLAIYKVDLGVPTLGVAPAAGPPGSTVVLDAGGFSPGDHEGLVTWDGQPLKAVWIPVDGVGRFEVTVPADAAVGPHTLTLCAGPLCPSGQMAQVSFAVERAIAGAPADLQRRAVEQLEELRGTPAAPGWDYARLSGAVRPLYRPDLQDPAYYEFAVVAPADPDARAGDVLLDPTPAGFIVLAAGEHDFPVAHWSSQGLPPTAQLDAIAAEAGKRATRYYKLDALTYVAEDAQGQLVATLGALPDKPAATGASAQAGAQPAAWSSWSDLKAGYAASYGDALRGLAQDASEEWQALEDLTRVGGTLVKGGVYDLALLADQGALVGQSAAPTVTLSGVGAAMVSGDLRAEPGLPYTYRITVNSAVDRQAVPLDVTVAYAGGRAETISFAIVARVIERTYLPVVIRSGLGGGAGAADAGALRPAFSIIYRSSWSSWSYTWADRFDLLPAYREIPAGASPNTTACPSGPGPTAWAALFGYGDVMAALGYPAWASYSGIYRQGGGRGADAVAPLAMDEGVRAMTWELHELTKTTCNVDAPLTRREEMAGAAAYLAGRTSAKLNTYSVPLSSSSGRPLVQLGTPLAGSLIGRTRSPVVVGVGLNRYGVAVGTMTRSRTVRPCKICFWSSHTETEQQIYVNQLAGGPGDGWVANATWFVGWIGP